MGGDDRKITVGGRNCKRGHAAWYCLHDMMQDDLTYGREARGISESTSEGARENLGASSRNTSATEVQSPSRMRMTGGWGWLARLTSVQSRAEVRHNSTRRP